MRAPLFVILGLALSVNALFFPSLGCGGKTDSVAGADSADANDGSPSEADADLDAEAAFDGHDAAEADACQCSLPHATGACNAGCVVQECDPGYADCNANSVDGCETNLQNDDHHCGACDNDCYSFPPPLDCENGQCSAPCGEGESADCDGILGCETSLQGNPDNCGYCGNVCGAGTICQGYYCCPPGYAECDHELANGCEAKLESDPNNCGYCWSKCGSGTTCVSGKCVCACQPGWGDCDSNCANGCETNLLVDALHCGSCDKPCDLSQSCADGVCQ